MRVTCVIIGCLMVALTVSGAEPPIEEMNKAATYLIDNQKADGSWGKAGMPGITALCALAVHYSPLDESRKKPCVDKALSSVVSFAMKDGCIAPVREIRDGKNGPAYANYNTSLSLLALATIKHPDYTDTAKAARRYLKMCQVADLDSVNYGGFGYRVAEGRSDLANTAWATEALIASEYLDREPHVSTEAKDIQTKNSAMWKRVVDFLETCHNTVKPDDTALQKEKRDGSFAYTPDQKTMMATMTYAGLKSLLYCKLKPSDDRVKKAWSSVCKNYTVTENPGRGMDGYYSYIYIVARALNVYNQDEVVTSDGSKHLWKKELSDHLLTLQKPDGSWSNEAGRFMESLPELSTSYALLALANANGRVKRP